MQNQILKNNPKVTKDYASRVAFLVDKYSKKYGIPVKVYTAILMQESAYKLGAVNKKCNIFSCKNVDFGIAQINLKTIKTYKFDKDRLTTDLEYSIEAGAKVLSYFKRFSKKEPHTWWSRYNTGTRPKSQMLVAYNEYVSLVSRYH